MELNKNKVLVGMSGGVDSSVTAALLQRQGYEVIGFTITPFKIDEKCRTDENERSCCSYQGLNDASDVCSKLKIEHLLADYTKEFQKDVVDNFVDEYKSGRTPNPCVVCNYKVKWEALLQKADEIGAKFVATGHYAKIYYNDSENRFFICKGKSNTKDQSYFLWKLSQEQLSRTLFPLAELEKSQVRDLAKEFELTVHQKAESQEICFIPNDDYKTFLKQNYVFFNKIFGGDIVLNGKVIGRHQGYPFYTIGQRKGMGISYPEPLYVKEIIPETNTLVVDVADGLFSDSLTAHSVNFMKTTKLNNDKLYDVKIRYKDTPSPAMCLINESGNLVIKFEEKKKSISPGQSVVVYEGDEVVCGGIII